MYTSMFRWLFGKETDEQWLAEYLRLEYGESRFSPFSIKARHLEFLGEFIIDDVKTKYCSYPHTGEPSWVTIQELGAQRAADITDVPPPNQET